MISFRKYPIAASLLVFASAAPAQTNCTPPTTQIFQRYAVTASPTQSGQPALSCTFTAVDPDLQQLERDMVSAWLNFHQLPQSDSSIIYQYGRVDLRNQIRSMIFTELERIISEDPATRTPHEQAVYNIFAGLIQNLNGAQNAAAATDASNWQKNPCAWRPDSQIAQATGVSYNPTPFCSGNPLIAAFSSGPPVPTKDYFLAAALKNTYGAAVTFGSFQLPPDFKQQAYGPAAVQDLQNNNFTTLGYGALAGAAIGGGASALTYTFLTALNPSTNLSVLTSSFKVAARDAVIAAAKASGTVATEAAFANAEAAGEEAAAEAVASITFDFVATPLTVILTAVEIGVEAGIQLVDYNKEIADVQSLIANAFNNPYPNLQDYLNDNTGLYKLQLAFISQTLPEAPSTEPLPQHRQGVDAHFLIQAGGPQATPTVAETLTYKDLAGTTWNVQTYGGWFVKTGALANGQTSASISPTITVTDPNNVTWAVDRIGDTFLLTKTQRGPNDMECPANPMIGVSDSADVETGNCLSWVSHYFQLQDGTVVTLAQKPVIPGDGFAAVAPGKSFTVDIFTLASPQAHLDVSGALPAGVTFKNVSPGVGELSGIGPAQGVYTVQITATNPAGRASQTLRLVSATSVQIITPAEFNMPFGAPTTFTVRATGYPAPKFTLQAPSTNSCSYPTSICYDISQLPLLPPGIAFKDNGDGTATLSGTALYTRNNVSLVDAFYESLPALVVIASNGITESYQTLQITLQRPFSPILNGPFSTTFTPKMTNSFMLNPVCTPTTSVSNGTFTETLCPPALGSSGAISFSADTSKVPWLRFRDNHDGTATLLGEPPPTLSDYDVPVTVTVAGAGLSQPVDYAYNVHVSALPVFLDNPDRRVMVCPANGRPCPDMTPQTNMASGGRFTLGANAPSPASVVQSGSNGIVKFAGATVGGAYPISVIATDNAGSATATYTYYLSEPPGFPTAAGASAIDFWLMEGVAASISIPTTGYPHDVGVTNSTGKQLLPQMVLTLRDIPRGMTFTSTTAAGIPTGTGLLSGKPDAGSARDFRSILEANNGVRANIEVKYHVRKPGDVNDDGQVDCQDRTTLTDSFGLHSGQTGFDARADLNNDGTVDAADSAILTRFLGLVCGGTLPYNPL